MQFLFSKILKKMTAFKIKGISGLFEAKKPIKI
jgi:hypothetical protein